MKNLVLSTAALVVASAAFLPTVDLTASEVRL